MNVKMNTSKDLDFFKSRILNTFSPQGNFTKMRMNLLIEKMSPIYIGCKGYRYLVKNSSDQYIQVNPLIPQLLEIGKSHPFICEKICAELTNVADILYEFEKIGRFKEAEGELDLFRFLLGRGDSRLYDDNDSLTLELRLIQAIDSLRTVTLEQLGLIKFPEYFTIELNMTTNDRICYTSEGPSSTKVLNIGTKEEGSKKKEYIKRNIS